MSSNRKLKKEPVLPKKAIETIKRYNMLDCGAVIVGVSGGADSMALIKFLCDLREEKGIKVYAAHINHLLRGEEAARDENFVREWCSANNVELFVLKKDVKALAAQRGKTVEEAGRCVRYGFFNEKANELNAKIATAHTLSDSIETQIFNLARGAGLHGLCGIPPVRGRIIRPLLRCTRRDTEEYCAFNGIKYVNDSTNFSRDYTRNRIRLDIVPKLYALNPAFDRAESRLIDSAEEDEDFFENEAQKVLDSALIKPGTYFLDKLSKCHPAVLKRFAAAAAQQFSGTAQEAVHINAVTRMVLNGTGKTEIKGGCFAEVLSGQLVFSKPYENEQESNTFRFPFKEGRYENGIFSVTISKISEKNLKKFSKQYLKNVIDCDKIKDNAIVRARNQGDEISLAGRNVAKTLKKLYNEAKIPVEERAYIPVAADDEGVFWVGKFGSAQRCMVTEGTKNAVLLEINYLEV